MALLKKRSFEQVIQVPMSSMIDVVFLLLIYFIVTHKEELSEAHLAVNLPSPGVAKTQEVKPRLLELEVRPGEVYLQGVPRPIEIIEQTLAFLGNLDPDQTVMVKTSLAARTHELVRVLDLCKKAGLTKLNLVAIDN